VVSTQDGNTEEVLPRTFEDSLIFENLAFFRNANTSGIVERIHRLVAETQTLPDLSRSIHELLKVISKGTFALDLLFVIDPSALEVPRYIRNGLTWLDTQLDPPEFRGGPSVQPVPDTSTSLDPAA
jgi:hypothetical protein